MAKTAKRSPKSVEPESDIESESGSESSVQKGGAKRTPKKSTKTSSNSKTSKKTTPAPKRGTKGKGKGKGGKTTKGKSTGKDRKKKERYFKLIDAKTLKSYGRYTGETPKQAASKGYTKLVQKMKENEKTIPKEMTIYLRESTRGGSRKVYGYSASRQKLPQPQELIITDKATGLEKTITYHYRNKIHKIGVPPQIGGAVKKPAKTKRKTTTKRGRKGTTKHHGSKTSKKQTTTKPTKATKKSTKKSTASNKNTKKKSRN